MIYLLFLAALMVGCDNTNMVNVTPVQTSTVTWMKIEPATCGTQPGTGGCAMYSTPQTFADNHCTVFMAEDAPDMIVAEEFKHCFGWAHR